MSPIVAFLADDAAATAVEYAVLLALILMTAIATISTVGQGSGGMWGSVQQQLMQTNGQ